MDVQSEKLNFIHWFAQLHDVKVIEEFLELKQKREHDWWEDLTEEEKKAVEAGIAQAEEGEVLSAAAVDRLTAEKFPSLFE